MTGPSVSSQADSRTAIGGPLPEVRPTWSASKQTKGVRRHEEGLPVLAELGPGVRPSDEKTGPQIDTRLRCLAPQARSSKPDRPRSQDPPNGPLVSLRFISWPLFLRRKKKPIGTPANRANRKCETG